MAGHKAVADETKVEVREIPSDGSGTVETSLNQTRFNHREWQSELGLNVTDMDLRQYDNAIGRFNCIDPITHFSQSPYHFANNNPMYYSDPSGMDGVPINTWHYASGGASNSFLTGGAGNLANGDHMFGGSGDEFWTGQGATTWSASPISVSGNNITINWSSFGDGKTKWTKSTNTIKKVPYVSGFGTSLATFDNSAVEYAAFASAALVVDDPTVIGFADDILIPGVWAIAGISWAYNNRAAIALSLTDLAAKQAREIERIRERLTGPLGVQYALTASGYYPNVRGGTTYLNQGDVWKYGETTSTSRYSDSYLKGMGLNFVPQFAGNQIEIKIQEKNMIYGYFFTHGSLPPGNKIFR